MLSVQLVEQGTPAPLSGRQLVVPVLRPETYQKPASRLSLHLHHHRHLLLLLSTMLILILPYHEGQKAESTYRHCRQGAQFVPKTVYYSRRRGTTNHTEQRGVEPETSRTIVVEVIARLLQPAHALLFKTSRPRKCNCVTVECQQVEVGLGTQGNVRSLAFPQNIRLCAWGPGTLGRNFRGPRNGVPARSPLL